MTFDRYDSTHDDGAQLRTDEPTEVEAPDHRVAQLLEKVTFNYMRAAHDSDYNEDGDEVLAEKAHEYATYLANQTEDEIDTDEVEETVRAIV